MRRAAAPPRRSVGKKRRVTPLLWRRTKGLPPQTDDKRQMTTSQSPSPIRAPELSGAIAWLNVPAPLTLKALRGKVVLLDFWTYGCIN